MFIPRIITPYNHIVSLILYRMTKYVVQYQPRYMFIFYYLIYPILHFPFVMSATSLLVLESQERKIYHNVKEVLTLYWN